MTRPCASAAIALILSSSLVSAILMRNPSAAADPSVDVDLSIEEESVAQLDGSPLADADPSADEDPSIEEESIAQLDANWSQVKNVWQGHHWRAPSKQHLSKADKYEYRELRIQGVGYPLRILSRGSVNNTFNVRMSMFSDKNLLVWQDVPADKMHPITASEYAERSKAFKYDKDAQRRASALLKTEIASGKVPVWVKLERKSKAKNARKSKAGAAKRPSAAAAAPVHGEGAAAAAHAAAAGGAAEAAAAGHAASADAEAEQARADAEPVNSEQATEDAEEQTAEQAATDAELTVSQ